MGALDDVSVVFEPETFSAIMGPSGSGKTTLVQVAAGLDRPDRGLVRTGAAELTAMRERGLARVRRQRVGFVFQSFNLLPSLTAAQNWARLAPAGSPPPMCWCVHRRR